MLPLFSKKTKVAGIRRLVVRPDLPVSNEKRRFAVIRKEPEFVGTERVGLPSDELVRHHSDRLPLGPIDRRRRGPEGLLTTETVWPPMDHYREI